MTFLNSFYGLKHKTKMSPVGLVLATANDGVSDVVADEGGEVGRLEYVDHRHELGRVDRVTCGLSRHS